jgi:flavin reductase (DIM6/NTAB) family NADH-FMN oxidoreductase RutF
MNIEAFFKVTYGLYVVSSAHEDKLNGYVSNTVFQVTADPARFAVACSKQNHTASMIEKSRIFSVSVLDKNTGPDIIGTFGYRSGKDFNKFESCKFHLGKTGAPVLLENVIAWFDCEVTQIVDTGTHILYIGDVVDCDLINPSAEPMTYAYYREVKKGKAPKNAPTYIEPEKLKKKALASEKYYCTACGYVYDPEIGDPENGFPPGTRFEDLPDTWVCPVCGTPKEDFAKKEV